MVKAERKIYLIIGFILTIGLLYCLSPILPPFIIGAFLAYLFDPLVRKLKIRHVPHYVSIGIVFFTFFLILIMLTLLLIPLLQSQADNFADFIPNTIDLLQNTILPWVKDTFGINVSAVVNVASIKKVLAANGSSAGDAATVAVKAVVSSGFKIVEWTINLILIPVVAFYLLCDWDKFLKGIQDLIPRNLEPTFTRLMRECDEVLGAFLRGQLIVMLALGAIYAAGLSLVGLQVGVIVGVIAGILSVVPYLGTVTGVTIAVIAGYMQSGTQEVLLVLGVFVIGHLIEHMFLTPKLVGDRIGLHPVAVIFAILAGGCLFGFIGVLLALPVASVVMVWLRYLHNRYRRSHLYKS